jgi:hypothetical protein
LAGGWLQHTLGKSKPTGKHTLKADNTKFRATDPNLSRFGGPRLANLHEHDALQETAFNTCVPFKNDVNLCTSARLGSFLQSHGLVRTTLALCF